LILVPAPGVTATTRSVMPAMFQMTAIGRELSGRLSTRAATNGAASPTAAWVGS
jgi:hypothetical protein